MSEQERIHDRAYFHTGNSGFTISFITDRNRPYMEIHQSMFGVSSTYRIEIINAEMLDAIIRMAESFRKHVGDHPYLGKWHRDPVSVIDGIEYIPIHREFITGRNSTTGYTVGHNLMDINSKQIIETRMLEPEDWTVGGGSGSDSTDGSSRFNQDQIGHELDHKGKILDSKLPLYWMPKQSQPSELNEEKSGFENVFLPRSSEKRFRD